ncbi:YihA family ribosome biogenesis GTP-binding protein, partial [Patescibacteria group bacterium]|nr:YihA family ribosome biogenesis GTP-binding protein [Patescibacteria group bacterium]
ILNEYEREFIIVANKADKLKRSERNKKLKEILRKVGDKETILYSAKTGEGRGELSNKVFGN